MVCVEGGLRVYEFRFGLLERRRRRGRKSSYVTCCTRYLYLPSSFAGYNLDKTSLTEARLALDEVR